MSWDHIITLAQTLLSLGPLVAIIWRGAKLVAQVEENVNDINNLGKKVNQIADIQHNEQKQLAQKMDMIDRSVVEISTTMRHINDTLIEMKRDIRELRHKVFGGGDGHP